MRVSLIDRLLLTLLILCAAAQLSAQTTTSGALAGVITDPGGAVVPDATVQIEDQKRGITQTAKSGADGVYQFSFLLPGRYALSVGRQGFREEKRLVDVSLGASVSVNIPLRLAKISTEINVDAEAPVVQSENADASVTMTQKQISELPNPGNDLTYVAQTAPGVVMNTDMQGSGNFSVLGLPATSNLYTIDGVNNTDNGTNFNLAGALGLFLGQNQIQEATVVTTGYSGQFGGAAGANISYITKSGSNDFHGNAQYYWNGRIFNANNLVGKAFGIPRPFDVTNQWAASLGGRIKKDKLFFIVDNEGSRIVIPQTNLVVIPSPAFQTATINNINADPRFGPTSATAAFYQRIFHLYNSAPGADSAVSGGLLPEMDPTGCGNFTQLGEGVNCAANFVSVRSRTSADTLTSGRLDWNVGPADRASARVQYDVGLGAFYADSISRLFDADYTVSWWQGSLTETHTIGATGASQFLAAASYFVPNYHLTNPSQAIAAFPTTLNFMVPGTFTNLGGIDWIGASGRINTKYQLSEDIVQTHGPHKFGVGANFERTWWKVFPYQINATGQLFPQTLDAFFQGGIDPVSPSTDFTSLSQSFSSERSARVAFFTFGFYGQDEWHARPSLALTLALRLEHFSNPLCQSKCFARLSEPFSEAIHDAAQPYNQAVLVNQSHAIEQMDNILWSPRFGFVWQPLGVSRNTVIRGGVGIFYDSLQGGLAEPFYLNAPLYNQYTVFGNNLSPLEMGSLFKDAATSNTAFIDGFSAGKTLQQLQAAIPGFFPPGINAAARRLHSPQFQRWSFELQQAFGANTSLSIGYFGHHGIHELFFNNSANAYCDSGAEFDPSGSVNPCFRFRSDLPLTPPDSRFSKVVEDASTAVSNYNGMVASFKHRFTRWTQGVLQANYTLGHAFDEISNGGIFSFTSVGLTNPQDPKNLRGAYGPAEYDVRHSFNANYVWELPLKAVLHRRGPTSLVSGWQISGTIFLRTGLPYTVTDPLVSGELAQNNYSGAVYAVPAKSEMLQLPCGSSAFFPASPSRPCQPPQVLPDGSVNPDAHFVQARCETGFNSGNLPGPLGPCGGPAVTLAQGRNRFRGPAYFNTDFTMMKYTKIPGRENVSLAIGLQFFNLFNHPNFGFPDNTISSPTLGEIFGLERSPTGILGNNLGGDTSARMIQLKAQLQF